MLVLVVVREYDPDRRPDVTMIQTIMPMLGVFDHPHQLRSLIFQRSRARVPSRRGRSYTIRGDPGVELKQVLQQRVKDSADEIKML